jgi:excisionase family DNA binding protein
MARAMCRTQVVLPLPATASTSTFLPLRTAATIQKLQSLPALENGQAPVLRYFTVLMETSKLNKVESLELARPALQQGKVPLIEKWLGEEKLTCSEQLGDMVMALNPKLALSIFLRSGDAHEKVVQTLLATGDFAKIVPYALKFNYRPNFIFILQQLVHANPKAAEELAKQLVKESAAAGQPPLLEIPAIIDVFMQFQRLQEATAFLLDVLAEDKAEQGFLQTKLLEMNLLGGAPQVAHAVLEPAEDEVTQARDAGRQLARLLPDDNGSLRLVTDDNRHEMIAIPPGALRLFVDVLTQLGQGRAVTLLPQRAELTTQEVADYLNVSRPYVVGLIEQNKLPARKVGTRRRIAFEDLVRFEGQDRAKRRTALDELARIDQELGL